MPGALAGNSLLSPEKYLGEEKIDALWDNTYGPVASAVYERMNIHGRVVICGEISMYQPVDNVTNLPKAVDQARLNHLILDKRLRVEGILVMEYFSWSGEAIPKLMDLHEAWKLKEKSFVL